MVELVGVLGFVVEVDVHCFSFALCFCVYCIIGVGLCVGCCVGRVVGCFVGVFVSGCGVFGVFWGVFGVLLCFWVSVGRLRFSSCWMVL